MHKYEKLLRDFETNLPETKLILSEVTPRMDALDQDVLNTSNLLYQLMETKSSLEVTIRRHTSLRNLNYYTDDKHIN